jgi:hypothetical protein
MADKVIDVAKFQKFAITLILLAAYTATAIDAIEAADSASDLRALPRIAGAFVTLVGISHAAYLGGKLPSPPGIPDGMTELHKMDPEQAKRVIQKQFAPRNQPHTAMRGTRTISRPQVRQKS